MMNEQKGKTMGIARNKMNELLRLKGRKKIPIKRFSKAALKKTIDDEQLIRSTLLSDSTKSSEIQLSSMDGPAWLSAYRDCTSLLREVDHLQEEINKEKIRKMSSISQKKHDFLIQKLAEQATSKLNACEKKLKQAESLAAYDVEYSQVSRKTFGSMLMSMAANIRDKARKLRSQQQSQLQRERQFKSYDNNILATPTTNYNSDVSWLSQQQFQTLEASLYKQKDEQINKIVQSIYSLNSIYKELQNLVIEQGSLLDRIDEHIDHTVQNVKKAKQHLEQVLIYLLKANNKQQNGCFRKLRLYLIIAIAVMFLIFIIKHS